MRIRTGITPDAWRDDGPATPYSVKRYSSVQVEPIATMRRIVTDGGNFLPGTGRPKAQPMHVVERP